MITKSITVWLLIASLLCIPVHTFADEEMEAYAKDLKGAQMAVDALIARPLGLVSTILGGAVFIVALPFSALGGNTKETYQRLVEDPAKYTFKRPLGNFHDK